MPSGYMSNGKPNSGAFKKGHSGFYKGRGGRIDHFGYARVFVGHKNGHTEYQLEHRIVMEKHIGRKLKYEERIHHIDGNKKNNDISNLVLFSSPTEHGRYHACLMVQ